MFLLIYHNTHIIHFVVDHFAEHTIVLGGYNFPSISVLYDSELSDTTFLLHVSGQTTTFYTNRNLQIVLFL